MRHVRPPAVAGLFYPADARELAADVGALLAAAPTMPLRPKALIVPHAGYVYSGPVAARAYALLKPLRKVVRRVAMFGPAHRVYVRGLAVPTSDAFATPLGEIPLDREAIKRVARLPQVQTDDVSHASEHSLEVQLPFLQTVLDDFELVPLCVGEASGAAVAEVMEALWGDDETLIVASSDLSHYHTYAAARTLDRRTADDVIRLSELDDFEQACGALPINGLVATAQRHRLTPHLLDLRNSGDTAGDKSRVVGYAAFAFTGNGNG